MVRFILFLLYLSVQTLLFPQICHAAGERGFERFLGRHDANGDGVVSWDEFKGGPKRFARLDLNGDGSISFEEFKQARQNPPQPDKQKQPRPPTPPPPGVKVLRDLEYASIDGNSLRLDLYLPEKGLNPPLFVWIHGGGWTHGDKSQVNSAVVGLATAGFAVASLNYRLGGITLHPKQVEDIKGAVRWLRANAKQYGYHARRVGVGGGSSGAHLALLLGLSGGVTSLEGEVGDHLSESSRVQAIVDLYGPSDLQAFAEVKPRFRRDTPEDIQRSASPLRYLSQDDPPLLILHGDQDGVVPLDQSRLLHERYQQAGLISELHVLHGAGHGGRPFKDQASYELIKDFLTRYLRDPAAHEQRKPTDEAARSATSSLPGTEVKTVITDDEAKGRLHGFHWMIGPRTGLAGSEQGFQQLLEAIDRNLSSNPYITGVYLIYHWRLLEPRPGELDFERLDKVIERVRKHGRYYKLAVNPGIYSPDWLYAQGAQAFDTVGSNPARAQIYQKPIRIPVPWDPIYQARYFQTMAKVAAHFRDDRQFRAITLTVATFMSPEWHLPKSAEDRQRWQSLPGFPEKLQQAWEEGIDRFAELYPGQYLVLEASSNPVGLKKLADAVVRYGATRHPGRFVIQINQLTGTRDQFEQPGYRKLLEYKKKYGSQILLGLQNLKGWGGEKLREKQGSEQMSVYNFVQAGGDYWELWYHDGGSREICETLFKLQQEAVKLGLDRFRQELIREGEYRPARKT